MTSSERKLNPRLAAIRDRMDLRASRERARAESLRRWSDAELRQWSETFRGVELRARNCLVRIGARRKRARIDAELARRHDDAQLRVEG